ncbi:tail fiber domain-containing protein [Psychroserpens sp. SPM9]|uniref:tail fiber domain-containing protein n=1 Tax=Psychroserpens sp. SPM9 TaxID=2975598 RepID=UPI0021A85985|nr:tail fiber domain-containing protein [Psychroserpens sp. SPM9]MDG5490063.1 tail fiber domain-containing protein [Psychroserpens sp. SPM9]
MNKLLFISLLFPALLFAQVGIGTTSPNSSLDIRSSNQATPANTDGILIPKVDTFPATDPNTPQDGILIYLTTNATHNSIAYTKGFHYWDDTATRWVPLSSIERINDLLDGKSDVDGSNDGSSIFLGIGAGENDDSSHNKNIGIGYQSLNSTVGADANDPEGINNVAIGFQSLRLNTTGRQNVGIGSFTLDENTTGFNNTAVGHNALNSNVDGLRNTALGQSALSSNISGNNNTAVGGAALSSNTSGLSNVAIGAFSLTRNETGINNVAAGNQSLRFNLDGSGNVALGDYAGRSLDDTSGTVHDNNVYIGSRAGDSDVESSNNVYIGFQAGAGNYNPEDNTGTAETKSGNIFIGFQAGLSETTSNKLIISNSDTDISNSLIYGNFGNNKLRVNDFLGIGKNATTNALEVNGEASKTTAGAFIANSDRRLKKNINTIKGETALETLNKLRGVTYEWNDNSTGNNRPKGIQYGFIAQELREVFPEKVSQDKLGFYQTAYGDYDAFFVEAIKELHDKIKRLELENNRLKQAENKLQELEARLLSLESTANKIESSIILSDSGGK